MQNPYAMTVHREDFNEKNSDQLSLNEYVVPFKKNIEYIPEIS